MISFFFFISPLELTSMLEETTNLNLTTQYTIVAICKTQLQQKPTKHHVQKRQKRKCRTVERKYAQAIA